MKKECALIRAVKKVSPCYDETGSISAWNPTETHIRAKTRRLKTIFSKADLGIKFDVVGEGFDISPRVVISIWDCPECVIKGKKFSNDKVLKILIDECVGMKKRAEGVIAALGRLKKEVGGNS